MFTSGERILAPFSKLTPAPPTPPGYDPASLCCTEHFEAELPPVDAAGRHFVVPKSPLRSDGGYVEPDLARVVATADGTQVATSLPAPMNQFTLQAGQARDVWAVKSFTVSSSAPVLVAQVLVSGTFTTQKTGDPSVSLIPDVEQQRTSYAFVAPPGYSTQRVVLVSPVDNTSTVDGQNAGCSATPIGKSGATSYERIECPVTAGAHHISGTKPMGAFIYGYSATGSYAIALTGN